MGLKIGGLLLLLLQVVVIGVSLGEASWRSSVEVISGAWGEGEKQFGLSQGDSWDDFPGIEAITPDGKIVITDTVNKKQIVFDISGNFMKEVRWIKARQEGTTTYYDIPEYSFGPIVGYSQDGNIFTGADDKYYLKSPTGQILQTYTERPLELGWVTEDRIAVGQYKVTVKYPDKVCGIIGRGAFPRYMRDLSGNLYGVGDMQVARFNDCGKEIARLTMPSSDIEEIPRMQEGAEPIIAVAEEYGSPVLAPNGDVYTWKRTPDKYSIIKWAWQDDPNPPANVPDAPTGLIVKPLTGSLSLTWKVSPQDPGCVTGYEIARSTTEGSGYTAIGVVDKSALQYEDTAAEAGTTYYYKVRAKGGDGYSEYSNEASGKR